MSDPNPFSQVAVANAIHSTLDSALSTIPTGQKGVLLARVTGTGQTAAVDAAVAMRVGDDWELAAGAGASWGKDSKPDPNVSFAVMHTW